jgi:Tol biopolymer transport system component
VTFWDGGEPLPDGSGTSLAGTIAYERCTTQGPAEIWLWDGEQACRLISGGEPRFSPAGTWLAYSLAGDIYRIKLDGAGALQPQKLTTRGDAGHPRWSPDGKAIYFSTHSVSSGYQAWRMNADGSGEQQLQLGTPGYVSSLRPDGKRLLANVYTTGWQVFRYDVGSDGAPISSTATAMTGSGRSHASYDPKDPSGVVYVESQATADFDIFSMNADSTNKHPLTDTTTEEIFPVYSPDGLEIVFASRRGGGTRKLHRMSAAGEIVGSPASRLIPAAQSPAGRMESWPHWTAKLVQCP